MASRLAHTFMEEVVANATHGIDLHTGALNRTNLPQVRVSLDQEDAVAMAHGFRVPLILHANLRDGSMRQTVLEHGVPVLLYEAGEALRLDERSVRIGLRGVVSVMRGLGMLPKTAPTRVVPPLIARSIDCPARRCRRRVQCLDRHYDGRRPTGPPRRRCRCSDNAERCRRRQCTVHGC